ncbi:plexin domain-containing protein 2 isoform X1 [Anopheles cruzii]|uniref:plexin domain-containing protein 2 isoform X1 n=1 Tax=Anopheles cruzii TaxID=68878 RepID=UPI0022EC5AA5|nr:plexin domain-containing protein 2 isoform X1 [Anopheles cruzii]
MKMDEFRHLPLCWLALVVLFQSQFAATAKVPISRKYLQSDILEPGSGSATGAPATKNETSSWADGFTAARPVMPLNENKLSPAKLKLQNENMNVKKLQTPPVETISVSGMQEGHLLGVNGTGQRKDYSNVSSTIGPIVGGVLKQGVETTTLSDQGVVTGSTDESSSVAGLKGFAPDLSTKNPLSDAINSSEQSEAELNSTLKEHNITKSFEDNHLYYKSMWSSDVKMSEEFWKKITANLTVNRLLSNSHRRATTMLLSFDFPYYGFPIRNITIASGGFLYTGDYVHSWLASTQYIAPLMANFDTSVSEQSFVKYNDDGETFTVVWENVILQDRPNNGSFTFSVTLNKSGDIVFAYKKIPINIQQIIDNPSTKHPVKIGLSDAYIIDKTIIRTKQKTIYEYHRVNFGQSEVQNGTVITLTALPTCFSFKDCDSCITHEGADFKCLWCPTINRCSTGTDRKRQDWVQKGCDKTTISELSYCPAIGQKGNNYGEPVEVTPKLTDNYNNSYSINDRKQLPGKVVAPGSVLAGILTKGTPNGAADDSDSVNKVHAYHTDLHDASSSSNLIVSMLIVFLILFACASWVMYAYRNPHTKSGQLLIRIAKAKKYRPNKWSWRRGEARYTAATIHM